MPKVIWYSIPLTTVGGGERLLLEGLRWFRSQGIDALLFADGEPVAKEALFDSRYEPSVLIYPRASGKSFFNSVRTAYNKVKFLSSHNPDLIIANSQAEAWKIFFYNLFSRKKIPYICFIHGSFFQFHDEINKYALIFRKSFSQIWENDEVYKALIPRKTPAIPLSSRLKFEIMNYLRYLAVQEAKVVFVMTRKQKIEIELLYKNRNVIVNHGAFNRSIFEYKQQADKKAKWNIGDKTMLFSMCRLVTKKRVDLIIRSFAIFYRDNPNTVLFIGGSGPEKQNLQQLAKDLRVENAVNFLGYIKDEELPDYYCSSALFVTADNADYDITTFVALALGKKVVASSQHEFEPHLKQLNLLFHANPTPEGFSDAFKQAIESTRPPHESRKNLLDDYSWEHYFNRILDHIRDFCDPRQGPDGKAR
jgi:glycosyltransferase involved in cell wall biosynthesis